MSEPVIDSKAEPELYGGGQAPVPPPPQSLTDQVIGVFTEPAEVFRRLRQSPAWVGAFILLMALGLVATLIWAHKVDQEAMIRNNMQVVEDVFHVPHNETALQTQLDKVSGQPYIKSSLGVVLGVPIVFLVFSSILFFFAKFGGEDDRVGFKHAWAVTVVHNLATLPIAVLAGLMCLIRPVGGAANYTLLNPANALFFVKPENALLRGLVNLLDPFYLFSFVLLYLAGKYTLRLKPWANVLVLCISGFFGLFFHFVAGIF